VEVIAAGCLVVCAQGQTLTIGEGAVVSAGSTVSSSIPAYTLCGAPRIKAFGKIAAPFTLGTAYDAFSAQRGANETNAEEGRGCLKGPPLMGKRRFFRRLSSLISDKKVL
jgi:hypothetical protein